MRIGDKAVHISDVSPTLHHGIETKCEHGHVWYSTVRVFCVDDGVIDGALIRWVDVLGPVED